MSKINDGPPAFPMPSGPEPRQHETHHYNEGMSLRDYFAGQALAGFMASTASKTPQRFAEECYLIADAMIAHRDKAD